MLYITIAHLEVREGLLREEGGLGDNAGEGKHGQTAILDLVGGISLAGLGVLGEAKGVEVEFSGLAARALGCVVDGSAVYDLKERYEEEENAEKQVGIIVDISW